LPPEVAAKAGIQVKSSAELAFRFVFANPNVDCAISGMENIEMLEQNVGFASNTAPLSAGEIEAINAAMEENKKLADLYCTGCNYCIPHCTQEVNISAAFRAMNYFRVYGMKEHAQGVYDNIGKAWSKGNKASCCIQCGECEEHCPQKIEIRKQLEECLAHFGA